jgi:FkbM family methyltransferase
LLEKRFGDNKKVVLYKAAAHTETKGKVKLYHLKEGVDFDVDLCGDGSSLRADKVNICRSDFENAASVDFSEFIKDNFATSDIIVLKIDIEGAEYDLLNKMIKDGTINYINQIFCEWHYDRVNVPKEAHDALVKKLQDLGFDLVGGNSYDEYKALKRDCLNRWKREVRLLISVWKKRNRLRS